MKVRDVLINVRELLNLPIDVHYNITGEAFGSAGQEEVNTLVRCFNAVENELAVDYLPLYQEDTVQTDTGAIFYTDFSRRPVRIAEVRDENGNAVKYKIFPQYLKTQKGKTVIRYSYAPEEKFLYSDSEYSLEIAQRLLEFGIATEYCLMRGMFEEASVWEKKYKQALKTAYKAYPSVILRSRRWL